MPDRPHRRVGLQRRRINRHRLPSNGPWAPRTLSIKLATDLCVSNHYSRRVRDTVG
jgi:hypothetical protein